MKLNHVIISKPGRHKLIIRFCPKGNFSLIYTKIYPTFLAAVEASDVISNEIVGNFEGIMNE